MPSFPLHRKLIYTSIIFFSFLFLLTLIGELGVRIFTGNKYKNPIPSPPYDSVITDDTLGWKPKPGYSYNGYLNDFENKNYQVQFALNKNGFKAFGDVKSLKNKVLFIGDSYTSNIEVSTKKTFYSILKDSLDFELFAYGQAGFGSLQEFLVLDKWIDQINPDLIVWQFCCNDFIDNYAPLEMECGYKIGKRRPYLSKEGNIFYQLPLSNWQKIKEKIFFYRWLEDHWHPFKKKVFGKGRQQGEDFIQTCQEEYLPFKNSIFITELIFEKLKKRIPAKTELIIFVADHYPVQIDAAQKIFKKHEIPFSILPAQNVMEAQKIKNCKTADGYHWNEYGQEIVAQSLWPIVKFYLTYNK